MLQGFIAGALAGYAIAVPVGAIAILIIDTGMRRGFRHAAAAGAGAASADLAYASLAVVAGTAVAAILAPIQPWLRIVAVVALLVIGGRGLLASLRATRAAAPQPTGSVRATYLRFLGLTILNPATIVYFAALILGLGDFGSGPVQRAAFVAGAFLASLSWQTLLAVVGAVGHRRLPARLQEAFGIVGNLVIIGFALGIATSLRG
jgi:threonine/homoserine/homoserine lactone efflux protein